MEVYEYYTTITTHIKCGTVELQVWITDLKSVSSHGLSSNKSLIMQEIKDICAKTPLLLISIISGYPTPKFKSVTE